MRKFLAWLYIQYAKRVHRRTGDKRVVLKYARSSIELYGWLQHTYGNKRVGFCASGAINETHEILNARNGAVVAARIQLCDTVNDVFGQGYGAITWNDAIAKTKDEVIKMFKRAESRCTNSY